MSRAAAVSDTPSGIDAVETLEGATLQGIYSADGMKLGGLQKGLNIVVYTTAGGKTVVRKVMK